jgi:hypothetical protein
MASIAGKCLRINSKLERRDPLFFSSFSSQHVGLEKKTQQLYLIVPLNTFSG